MAFRGFFNPVEAREKDFPFPGSTIVVMVSRDPSTGQFMAGDEYDDYEQVSFRGNAGVQAADLTGATGFQGENFDFAGLTLIDYDEIVDRNETLDLLYAAHWARVYQNSTATEDGTVAFSGEVSTSPARQHAVVTVYDSAIDGDADAGVVGTASNDDSIDLLGPSLEVTAHSPFSDTASGIGGGGSAPTVSWENSFFPGQMGQFHPRDELFLNGQLRAWNIDDAGVHVDVEGIHIYGVRSD